MLIDEFMPKYDVREHHQIDVAAPPDEVYRAVRTLNLRHATLTRWLFRLRGIPAPPRLTLSDFLRLRFILLGERPGEELLLGLVGQFWRPSGKLQRLDAEGFRTFRRGGYAKAVWNFSLAAGSPSGARLETETRVYCLDKASRRQFRLYWLQIGRVRGLIRREILLSVKREAEEMRRPAA